VHRGTFQWLEEGTQVILYHKLPLVIADCAVPDYMSV
jgi:hypothetical protein